MEKLFYYLVAGTIAIQVAKVFIFWITQKLLNSKREVKRMDAASMRVSRYFNKLLKAHALSYQDINSIYNILKKYSHGTYNNNIHLIYSVLKHEAISKKHLGDIEVMLDSIARKKKIKVSHLNL